VFSLKRPNAPAPLSHAGFGIEIVSASELQPSKVRRPQRLDLCGSGFHVWGFFAGRRGDGLRAQRGGVARFRRGCEGRKPSPL